MTDEELNEIQERLNRTTKGPWTSLIEGRDFTSGSSFIMTGTEEERYEDINIYGKNTENQDFIAHSRQDIPRLIEEIKRLKSILKKNNIDY